MIDGCVHYCEAFGTAWALGASIAELCVSHIYVE